MTNIEFYGAIHEIGGNKIILSTKETKILIDFGISFQRFRQYYSGSLTPRLGNYLEDCLEFGLIPDLSGLYKPNLERHSGIVPLEEPSIDAIIISHAHIDHCGHLGLIRSDIPVYCSSETFSVLQNLALTGYYGYSEFLATKPSFRFKINKKGRVSRMTARDGTEKRKFVIFSPGKPENIGDLTIHHYPVDHSLPGATALVIESPSGSVVYTGDIRFHGRHPEFSSEFVEKSKSFEPEVMLCEGTRITEKENTDEAWVEKEANSILKKTKGLAIINFPSRDVDRLISLHQSAKNTDRQLLVNFAQANLLENLSMSDSAEYPVIEDEGIAIYAEPKSWFLINKKNPLTEIEHKIERKDYEEETKDQILKDYTTWERKLLEKEECVVKTAEIRKNSSKYLLYCPYFVFEHLIDIKPDSGSFLWSKTIPFTEEMEMDKVRLDRWSQHFGLKRYSLHASGHASGLDLQRMINTIKPKKLIPIHTEHGLNFSDIHDKTIFLKKGEKWNI
ncbi:MAG: MBL fold metallo-hydrolase [Candidatus Hodarchaeales archaeon]|jgi:ribonuclease J